MNRIKGFVFEYTNLNLKQLAVITKWRHLLKQMILICCGDLATVHILAGCIQGNKKNNVCTFISVKEMLWH